MQGLREAYETGRGRVVMRARVVVEEKASTGKSALVVTEIPYQVNKARLAEQIVELVLEKKVEGITEVVSLKPTEFDLASAEDGDDTDL